LESLHKLPRVVLVLAVVLQPAAAELLLPPLLAVG